MLKKLLAAAMLLVASVSFAQETKDVPLSSPTRQLKPGMKPAFNMCGRTDFIEAMLEANGTKLVFVGNDAVSGLEVRIYLRKDDKVMELGLVTIQKDTSMACLSNPTTNMKLHAKNFQELYFEFFTKKA